MGLPFRAVRCPACGSLDDKVVDSRGADDGSTVRRRRQCLDCATRYTTFERLEETPLVVVKSSGAEVPFDRSKIVAGVTLAAKGRPVDAATIDELAADVEDVVRLEGTRAHRAGGPRGASPHRRGERPALRQRLQGLRRPRRLRAGDRPPHQGLRPAGLRPGRS